MSKESQQAGKLVNGKRYLHRDALHLLSESEYGKVVSAGEIASDAEWNVVKFHLNPDFVSLLHYPNFSSEPFPELRSSVTVDLRSKEYRQRIYAENANLPILHRKELLLAPDDSRRPGFVALSDALDARDLLQDAGGVGYREQWNARLRGAGLRVQGHELQSLDGTPPPSAVRVPRAEVLRHRTAIARSALSLPFQTLVHHGYLEPGVSVLDYGCGKGDDVRILGERGLNAFGWDPHYASSQPVGAADVVNLGFVINVIETMDERAAVLQDAFSYTNRVLSIAVMLNREGRGNGQGFSDGVLTSRRTFQKYFEQQELIEFVKEALDVDPVAVAPGVVLAFRNPEDADNFRASRAINRSALEGLAGRDRARTKAERLRLEYEESQEQLDSVWQTWLEFGREPMVEEVEHFSDLIARFGSRKRVLSFLRRYHGEEALAEARARRHEDLTAFLALELFNRWRSLQSYPLTLQRDAKAIFGSQRNARAEAAELLFAAGESDKVREACERADRDGVGYLDSEGALTVHTSAVERLAPLLRVYVGFGAQLYGDISGADLLKIHSESGKLSLMSYDDFFGKSLPRMLQRVKLDFRKQRVQVFDYGELYEPPYLYWKSRYLLPDSTGYEVQKEFDTQLAQLGMLDLEDFGPAPTELHQTLAQYRLDLDGFQLKAVPSLPSLDDPCGSNLTYRDLIECGETQMGLGLANEPRQPSTYAALARLALDVLDPVMDYFGGIELTYGFCSRELAKHIPARIEPRKDQHASHELNSKGKPICSRGGAAVDFLVRDESMKEVADWIIANTPFDRLYYYGDDKPLHVSIGAENKRQAVSIRRQSNGRVIPTKYELGPIER